MKEYCKFITSLSGWCVLKIKSVAFNGLPDYVNARKLFDRSLTLAQDQNSECESQILVLTDRIAYFSYIKRSYISKNFANPRVFHAAINGFSEGVNWKKLSSIFKVIPLVNIFRFRYWRKLNNHIFGLCLYNSSMVSFFYRLTFFRAAVTESRKFLASKDRLSYEYQGLKVGDLVVDTYLRFTYRPNIEKIDGALILLFIFLISDFRSYLRIFKEIKFEYVLTSYSSYTDYGVPVRLAIKFGANVVSFGNLFQSKKFLSDQDYYHSVNYMVASEVNCCDWDRFEHAKSELHSRLRLDKCTLFYMKDPSYKDLDSGYDIENAIIIYMHDFFDSQNMYSGFIFENFYSWISETVQYCISRKIPVFLKPHPNQMPESVTLVESLKSKIGANVFLSDNISLRSIVNSGCAGLISCYGSVLFESAFLGLKPISTTLCPPSVKNVAAYCRSKSDYFNLIENVSSGKVDMRSSCLAEDLVIQYYSELYLPPRREQFNDLLALRAVWAQMRKGADFRELKGFIDNIDWV